MIDERHRPKTPRGPDPAVLREEQAQARFWLRGRIILRGDARGWSAAYTELMFVIAGELLDRDLEAAAKAACAEGYLLGRREAFCERLGAKFGEAAAEKVLTRVAAADLATLDAWTDRLVVASTIEDALGYDH